MLMESVRLSEAFGTPVMLRLTTRVSHSKSVVRTGVPLPAPLPHFERSIEERVLLPAYGRGAQKRMHDRLAEVAAWSETSSLTEWIEGNSSLGIIASGVAVSHAREAAPDAALLKLGMTYPLPVKRVRAFAESVDRCVVIEEGDAFLAEMCLAAGAAVGSKAGDFRFGELSVDRVRMILEGALREKPSAFEAATPQLCPGCTYRMVFEVLRETDCIVAGDIGCYTLGALPPYSTIDTAVCMGASLGVGLGLRHALAVDESKRVVSLIGDSTFIHGGLAGLVEMAYNAPETGHVVVILDNGVTAMTGFQEHPGSGRLLDRSDTRRFSFEAFAEAAGIDRVEVFEAQGPAEGFAALLAECLESEQLCVIIVRGPCVLHRAHARRAGASAAHSEAALNSETGGAGQ